MTPVEISGLAIAGTPIIGGFGYWLVRLEAKANGANEKYQALLAKVEALDLKFDNLSNTIIEALTRQ